MADEESPVRRFGFATNLRARAETAEKERQEYLSRLEQSPSKDVFKNLLLMNTAALERNIAQTRLQAQRSFFLSAAVSIVGFVLIAVGISLGFVLEYQGKGLDAAYLAYATGLLTEFISGALFYMLNTTLQQLNPFHDKLITSQHISLSFMAATQLSDHEARDVQIGELAKVLMSHPGSE
jgi:hypothetical protein